MPYGEQVDVSNCGRGLRGETIGAAEYDKKNGFSEARTDITTGKERILSKGGGENNQLGKGERWIK